ncbi:PREDICTED: phytosulfokines 3-like [Fragaria vesca subsp. vesca]|uniref:phytosulfokines 3-like n=1 Tax=Fragaria vesca subsp. vesca TaxID=101020 RepID=UPI0002C2F15A|nr:PREDICTED: phytosulfokines 3-like [Fragaria vesca subsp. vesca]
MAKFTALFTIAALLLLLSSELTSAVRPEPNSELKTVQHQGAGADQNIDFEDGEVSCEGVNEEECLMRRTLVAHVDYIYTQKHKHP